jgi:hypothetical protein
MRKSLFIAVLWAGALGAAPQAFAQAQDAPNGLAQMQLTDAQVQQYLDAAPEVEAAMSAAPPSNTDAPDAKTAAKLEDIAKKHKFANYGEFDSVVGNIMLVLEGVDPDAKKYIGPEAELKKEIAALQADKQIPAEDKKSELAELNNELKTIVPIKFKSNIDLVLKYYDKIAAAQDQEQKQ